MTHKTLGKGAFGEVLLVKKKNGIIKCKKYFLDPKNKFYAMKILRKKDMIKKKLEQNVMLERDVLL